MKTKVVLFNIDYLLFHANKQEKSRVNINNTYLCTLVSTVFVCKLDSCNYEFTLSVYMDCLLYTSRCV